MDSMSDIFIRLARLSDRDQLVRLREVLWPKSSAEEHARELTLSFVSLRDNLDLSTPSGRLMFQIIGAMAEFERALIQERVIEVFVCGQSTKGLHRVLVVPILGILLTITILAAVFASFSS